MSENIMPLSDAVEGYALFDNMKVQKGTKASEYYPHVIITGGSDLRCNEVDAHAETSSYCTTTYNEIPNSLAFLPHRVLEVVFCKDAAIIILII